MVNQAGEKLICSVSFSSVLHEDDAIVLTFRDVTHERETAIELQQTKQFLERVIENSADAIVSADLQGQILLFNRAACQLLGYRSENVVGKLNAASLYEPGGARRVLRSLLDPRRGSRGKVEALRVRLVDCTGQLVDATVSASLILDGDIPVGTVGIFTDIREKLRMESRLQRAQEELRVREQLAAVSALAGTTAHELNQPLTSIIGYAEMLRRRIGDNPQLETATRVILSEAQRMADIVRKIGRITQYETQSYVGGARILDLEKATQANSEEDPQ